MEVAVGGGRSVNGVRRAKEVGGMEGQPLTDSLPCPHLPKMCPHLAWPLFKGTDVGEKADYHQRLEAVTGTLG